GVAELQQKHGKFLKGLRQLGLMMGLELVDELAGFALTKAAYDHDLLMIYANNDTRICQLLPPLTMHAGQVTEVMTQLDKALTSAARLHKLMRLKRWLSRGSD
ncbi:MAG: hypothetical protein K9N34_10430, partial [Candidatus Marinimicrobia bacterium]|nr:hypothetical protein [Candidatus Neomarinimicrobiota bacterium]MCF7840510.1 hypothetical protein [Candidatus Neomarinimicrobiota bacterium]